jgi:hypothetical protein
MRDDTVTPLQADGAAECESARRVIRTLRAEADLLGDGPIAELCRLEAEELRTLLLPGPHRVHGGGS